MIAGGENPTFGRVEEGRVAHEVGDGFFRGDHAGVALAAAEVPASELLELLEGARFGVLVARPSWVS